MSLTVTIAARSSLGIGSDAGGRRDNQDNYLVANDGSFRILGPDGTPRAVPTQGHGVLVAVADGMGGHDLGDVAASAAVQALAARWQVELDADGPEAALAEFLPAAHDRIRARCAAQGQTNMGTTLTALWLAGARAGWAQIGDSRLYQRRGSRVRLLTRDQTHAEFARRDGRPPGFNARYLAQSFIFGSRGLGDDGRLRLDPGVDTGSLDVVTGDRFLLCSDGVSGFVAHSKLEALLCADGDAEDTADALLGAALAAGSDDNLTVVTVDILDVPALPRLEPDAAWSTETTLVPLD